VRPSATCILSVSLLISGSIALSGCDRGVTISYHQVGICKGYDTAAGPVTARPDEGFAIFKIEAVDNTKPSESFDFDPTHLYVDQSTPEQKAKTAVWDKNRRFMYPDQRFAQNMGVSSAGETTIPEGTKREINGFAVVPLGINNPTEAISTLSTSCMILGLLLNTKRMGRADHFTGFSRWESRCSAARSWGLKLLT
jgi:hypothetical protein